MIGALVALAAAPGAGLLPAPEAQDPFEAGSVALGGRSYPWRLLAPERIEPGARYPLVLFLHGAGERGCDNRAQLAYFPELLATPALRERYPCFVLAPQCPEDELWVPFERSTAESLPFREAASEPLAAAVAALLEIARTRPVDRDRIVVTGLSMGGFGTWDTALRHAGWLAFAAPICGGGDERQASRLAGLGLSVWHGAADPIVAPAHSRRMVAALEELGLAVDYRELPGVEHDSWTAAYGDRGLLDALFAARRDPAGRLAATARLLAEAVEPAERIAFLGDSITQSGAEPDGYVDLLRRALAEHRPAARVIPAGVSGHRVPDLLARFQNDVIAQRATLVFVYIGINDVWHSLSGHGTPAGEYEHGLRRLVRELRASGAAVVLATPSVIGERPAGENPLDGLLAEYSELSRRVAAEEGATLCDLGSAFREHLALFGSPGAESGVLTTDGVHLARAGNVLVATEAARALREAAHGR